ncbi:ATP-binding cassette domain-containing protein [Olivibacter sp. SDN3]|uniref:ABC transporter ATP-binding protein n=1 Tax=Olivibacter sp. SDN3 TaxID=2764720 RepID=UPI0016517986|nr:ATP-binding cassette domain-containing protein [Olivibacter sp. SDN3]QNL47981.1 ATP-binding cassette domain-containing protein [Olivibacter sp. SDN3]
MDQFAANLAFRNIRFAYGKNAPMEFPDMCLTNGDHCLILGDSGSGKTTLLHILCGLLPPSDGSVVLNGVDLYGLAKKEMDKFRGQHIGLVLQQAHLLRSLTIAENLKMARYLAGLPKKGWEASVLLDRLGLTGKGDSYTHQLSQGQLQRAAIARALVNRPSLLVADEPTSSLDDRNALAVIDLLSEQAALCNASLIIATHDKRVKDKFRNTYQL